MMRRDKRVVDVIVWAATAPFMQERQFGKSCTGPTELRRASGEGVYYYY